MENTQLTKEQINAVSHEQAGAYAVKGIAGSGKTTVGLHRIPFLKERCMNHESILVVTFHKVLTDYLQHLNSKLTINGQHTFNFEQTVNVQIVNIDKLVYDKYLDYRQRFYQAKYYANLPKNTSSQIELKQLFKEALQRTRNTYSDVEIINQNQLNFLIDEVDYINSCRIDSLKQYQIFTRKGRNRFSDRRRNLPKKSRIREAVFMLRRNYNNELIKKGKIDFPVMRLLALREVIDNPPKQYTHIMIDESQDMDKVRMDFLKHFLTSDSSASATFLYDNTQSIYRESWLGNGHGFSTLGIDIKGKSVVLKKNFRTTFEIQDAAQSLLNNFALFKQEVEPELINRSGIKPIWGHCEDYDAQLRYIVDIIKTHQKNLELEDILILARTNKEAEQISNDLSEAQIDCTLVKSNSNSFAYNRVRIMTMNSSKGLESKMVILVNLNFGVFPRENEEELKLAQELKLMYVALTRASNYLYLTSYGRPSVFLEKISTEKISKVNFINYQWFEQVEDPKLKERMLVFIDNLEAAIQNFVSLQNSANRNIGFTQQTARLLKAKHEMDIIHEQLHELEKEIPANSSLLKLYSSLHHTCEAKLELAVNAIVEFIQKPPQSFEQCVAEIEAEYPNFSHEAIQSIASVEFQVAVTKIESRGVHLDCGPFLTAYSKVLEIELDNLFEQQGISLYSNRPGRNGKPGLMQLQEKLSKMRSLNGDYRDVVDMLESVDFRRKRNLGVHSQKLQVSEFLTIRKMISQERGVFYCLNKLLKL